MRLPVLALAALAILVAVACGGDDDDDTADGGTPAATSEADSTADASASPGEGGTDQRPPPATTFEVDSTADAVDANPGDGACNDGSGRCTLRAAIMEANALDDRVAITLPAGTYALSIAGAGEDAAATGDLDVGGDLLITGAGADSTVIDGGGLDVGGDLLITGAGADSTVIDGGGLDRAFHILPGSTVEIGRVAVRTGNRGDGSGGGIQNGGTLTLTDSRVSGNTAGIWAAASGTATTAGSP